MPALAVLVAVGLLWATMTGKIKLEQMPPVLLGIAGAFLAIKGQAVFGLGALAIAAAWFQGQRIRASRPSANSRQFQIDAARNLLGVGKQAGAEKIRQRHKQLISQNHPDIGGCDARASALNDARDLLLSELDK
jgi:hypothetical protein